MLDFDDFDDSDEEEDAEANTWSSTREHQNVVVATMEIIQTSTVHSWYNSVDTAIYQSGKTIFKLRIHESGMIIDVDWWSNTPMNCGFIFNSSVSSKLPVNHQSIYNSGLSAKILYIMSTQVFMSFPVNKTNLQCKTTTL